MTKGAQKVTIMFLSDFYLSFVGKEWLQAHNEKSLSLVKLLFIPFGYFIQLSLG